jgi:hypothetical protein
MLQSLAIRVWAMGLRDRSVAASDAAELVEHDTLSLDSFKGLTAIKHFLVEPSPRALPRAAWVDLERVQAHCQRTKAAVS